MCAIYKNFIYMEKHGFIFAYVPKVACTNWKSLMRYMAGHKDWLDNKLAHDKQKGGLRYLDLNGPDKALLDDPEIKKFAMVRDPYSRILSAYLNKIESRLPLGPFEEGEDHFTAVTRKIESYRQETLGSSNYPSVNLEVFLRWLINEAGILDRAGYMRADEHWASQTKLLRQPDVHFDVVGRFEAIAEDAPRLLHAMGCDQPFPTQKDVKFAPTKAAEKQNAYFTPVTRELVAQHFADDFSQFGYAHVTENA